MRTRKLEAELRDFFQKPPTEQSLLDGAVLIAQLGQVDEKHTATLLLANVTKSIKEIVENVQKLVSSCSIKSPSRIISFINQVLYKEMGFKGVAQEDLSMNHCFIDQVSNKESFHYA